jgi:hypothetical protein
MCCFRPVITGPAQPSPAQPRPRRLDLLTAELNEDEDNIRWWPSGVLTSQQSCRRCYSQLLKLYSYPTSHHRLHLHLAFSSGAPPPLPRPPATMRRRPARLPGSGAWPRCERSAAAGITTASTPTPAGPGRSATSLLSRFHLLL